MALSEITFEELQLQDFNPAEWIRSDEELLDLINEALADCDDMAYLQGLLCLLAHRRADSARQKYLLQQFAAAGNPTLSDLLQLMQACHLRLTASDTASAGTTGITES